MQSSEKIWWLYLLACRGGRTYAGIALDVAARFALHRSGKGAKFTRANPPHRILGAQAFTSRSDALKAEYALKQLTPTAKRAWARDCPQRGLSLILKQSAGLSPKGTVPSS